MWSVIRRQFSAKIALGYLVTGLFVTAVGLLTGSMAATVLATVSALLALGSMTGTPTSASINELESAVGQIKSLTSSIEAITDIVIDMRTTFFIAFWDDNRSQSVQIGVVLLLGVAVIAFASYQSTVVPSQNHEVEFSHFQDMQNDMVEVRNGVLTTGQSDVEQYPSVTLGTNYPPRLAALNPPPVSGTLRTSDTYDIRITNESRNEANEKDVTVNIPTRFIEYSPEYNQLRTGSIWYENSVLYLDERDQNGNVLISEEQQLFAGGNTLRITALQGDVSTSGTGQRTLELFPAENTTADGLPTGKVDIYIPTRLTAKDHWQESLPSGPYEAVYTDGDADDIYGEDIYTLHLKIDTSQSSTELRVNTVGIGAEPSNNPQNQNVGTSSDDNDTPAGLAIYRDGTDLKSVEPDGTTRTYSNSKAPEMLGPSADLTGDSAPEIPYVIDKDSNRNYLMVVNASKSETPSSLYEPSKNDPQPALSGRMAVGDLNGDGTTAVFFPDTNGNIHKYEGGDVTEVPVPGDVSSVAGVGQFDDDESAEVVYTTTSQNIRYSEGGSPTQSTSIGVNLNTQTAIGELSSGLDDDSAVEVAYNDGDSPYFEFADSNGNDGSFSYNGGQKETPIGVADWTSDGSDEIVFIDGNGGLQYIDSDGTTSDIEDSNGQQIQVGKVTKGVVVGERP